MSTIARTYQVLFKGGDVKWLPLWEASAAFNGGYGDTDLGMVVREPDGLERPIAQSELNQIIALRSTPAPWLV